MFLLKSFYLDSSKEREEDGKRKLLWMILLRKGRQSQKKNLDVDNCVVFGCENAMGHQSN